MRATLTPDDDLVVLVRAAPAGQSLTIVVEAGRDPLSLVTTIAALAPLAIERAPARVNAVLRGEGADPADIEAAAAWLDRADSTTGQLVEISGASGRTAPATR